MFSFLVNQIIIHCGLPRRQLNKHWVSKLFGFRVVQVDGNSFLLSLLLLALEKKKQKRKGGEWGGRKVGMMTFSHVFVYDSFDEKLNTPPSHSA